MAWRSVAESHAELVQQMIDNGVLQSPAVQGAFRAVDRGMFVYEQMRRAVYVDAPVKQNNLHMSAPHMYAAALEALDLRPNVTFLNVGSGTGWFNAMVAAVAGRDCINHGVEIHEDLVEHATNCYNAFCEHWAETHDPEDPPFPKISYFHGNGLLIDPALAPRYDRIYVGAACPQPQKDLFCQLLADDGILVLPVDDEFLRIHKLGEGQYSTSLVASVRFALLQEHLSLVPRLPAHVWSPSEHRNFPQKFKECVVSILLMLKSSEQASALTVHKSIWLEILSFASREWFTPEVSDLEMLQRQLQIERNARLAAEESLRDAKRARQEVVMERDYYRFMVTRLMSRLRRIPTDGGEDDNTERGENIGDDVDAADAEETEIVTAMPEPNIFALVAMDGLLGRGADSDEEGRQVGSGDDNEDV